MNQNSDPMSNQGVTTKHDFLHTANCIKAGAPQYLRIILQGSFKFQPILRDLQSKTRPQRRHTSMLISTDSALPPDQNTNMYLTYKVLVLQTSAVRDALCTHKIRVMLHFERNESTRIGERLKTIQLFYYLSPHKWRESHRWTKPESMWSPGVLTVLLLAATDGSEDGTKRESTNSVYCWSVEPVTAQQGNQQMIY